MAVHSFFRVAISMELHSPALLVASTLVCAFGFFYIAALLKQTLLSWVRRSSLLEISNKIVSAVHGIIGAYGGVIIVLDTRDGVIHGRHPWTNQIMLISTGYQLYDLWAMYYVFRAKLQDVQGEVPNDVRTVWSFLQSRPAIVIHHIWFILVAFPSTMWFRKGLGDFFVGSFYILDASTPFVCLRAILAEIGSTGGLVYAVNGIAMIVVFFVCRICIFPFMFYSYARYAGVSTFLVPFYIPKKCVCACFSLFLFQIYWLWLMFKGARKLFSKKK